MLLEAFIVGKSAKFWILIQKMLEILGMICFFWRVSIFCFSFSKLFTLLPSQSSIHLLHLRQWVGNVSCLELLFGRGTGYWHSVHSLQDGTDQEVFLSCLESQKAGQFPSAHSITHPTSLAPSCLRNWSGVPMLATIITLVPKWTVAHCTWSLSMLVLCCQVCFPESWCTMISSNIIRLEGAEGIIIVSLATLTKRLLILH